MNALVPKWDDGRDMTAVVYDDGTVMLSRDFGGFATLSYETARHLARYLLVNVPTRKEP